MVSSLEKWSKSEMRGVIRFLHAKFSSSTKFLDETVSNYGNDILNRR